MKKYVVEEKPQMKGVGIREWGWGGGGGGGGYKSGFSGS